MDGGVERDTKCGTWANDRVRRLAGVGRDAESLSLVPVGKVSGRDDERHGH